MPLYTVTLANGQTIRDVDGALLGSLPAGATTQVQADSGIQQATGGGGSSAGIVNTPLMKMVLDNLYNMGVLKNDQGQLAVNQGQLGVNSFTAGQNAQQGNLNVYTNYLSSLIAARGPSNWAQFANDARGWNQAGLAAVSMLNGSAPAGDMASWAGMNAKAFKAPGGGPSFPGAPGGGGGGGGQHGSGGGGSDIEWKRKLEEAGIKVGDANPDQVRAAKRGNVGSQGLRDLQQGRYGMSNRALPYEQAIADKNAAGAQPGSGGAPAGTRLSNGHLAGDTAGDSTPRNNDGTPYGVTAGTQPGASGATDAQRNPGIARTAADYERQRQEQLARSAAAGYPDTSGSQQPVIGPRLMIGGRPAVRDSSQFDTHRVLGPAHDVAGTRISIGGVDRQRDSSDRERLRNDSGRAIGGDSRNFGGQTGAHENGASRRLAGGGSNVVTTPAKIDLPGTKHDIRIGEGGADELITVTPLQNPRVPTPGWAAAAANAIRGKPMYRAGTDIGMASGGSVLTKPDALTPGDTVDPTAAPNADMLTPGDQPDPGGPALICTVDGPGTCTVTSAKDGTVIGHHVPEAQLRAALDSGQAVMAPPSAGTPPPGGPTAAPPGGPSSYPTGMAAGGLAVIGPGNPMAISPSATVTPSNKVLNAKEIDRVTKANAAYTAYGSWTPGSGGRQPAKPKIGVMPVPTAQYIDASGQTKALTGHNKYSTMPAYQNMPTPDPTTTRISAYNRMAPPERQMLESILAAQGLDLSTWLYTMGQGAPRAGLQAGLSSRRPF